MSSFATSYIKTTTTSVTRTKDILNYDIEDTLTQGQGIIEGEFEVIGVDSGTFPYIFDLTDGTTNNVISFLIREVTGLGRFEIKNGGSQIVSIDTLDTIDYNTKYKIRCEYEDNNCKLYVDDVLQGTDTSAIIPTTINTMIVGNRVSLDRNLNGNIKNLKYRKQ